MTKKITDQYGRTKEQFLKELFVDEYCSECGGDGADHIAVVNFPLSGLFYARCLRHPSARSWETTMSEEIHVRLEVVERLREERDEARAEAQRWKERAEKAEAMVAELSEGRQARMLQECIGMRELYRGERDDLRAEVERLKENRHERTLDNMIGNLRAEAQRWKERAKKAEAEVKSLRKRAPVSLTADERAKDAEIARLRSKLSEVESDRDFHRGSDPIRRDALDEARARLGRLLLERNQAWNERDRLRAEIEELEDDLARKCGCKYRHRLDDPEHQDGELEQECRAHREQRLEVERLREERRGGCETHEPISTPGCVVCQMEEAERLSAENAALREKLGAWLLRVAHSLGLTNLTDEQVAEVVNSLREAESEGEDDGE